MPMRGKEIDLNRASWIHHQDSADYGPYSSEDLSSLISKGEVHRGDSITDQFTGNHLPIEEVPHFAQLLTKREHATSQAILADEAEANYSTLKQRRILVPILLILLAVLGLAVGWTPIRNMIFPSSSHGDLTAVRVPVTPPPTSRFAAFASEAPPKEELSAANSKPAERIAVKKRVNAKKARPKRIEAPKKQPSGMVEEFDFAGEEIAAGPEDREQDLAAPLGAAELREFLSEILKPALMRCVRLSRDELTFPSYRVHLKLFPEGKLQFLNISPANAEVPKLKGCLDLMARRHQTRKFTGTARNLELPIRLR